nr:replication protein A 70 kDa DNA-binding subunit B [Tanacetum cinerariifolium]
FRLQICVQDESGTMSLTIQNDEVQAVVDRSAYQLRDKYGKARIFKNYRLSFHRLLQLSLLKYVRNKILKQQAHHFRQSLRWI